MRQVLSPPIQSRIPPRLTQQLLLISGLLSQHTNTFTTAIRGGPRLPKRPDSFRNSGSRKITQIIGYRFIFLSCWRKRVAKGCYIHFNIMFDPFLGTPHFRKCSHLCGLWLKKDHRSQGTGMKLVANVASRLLKETQTHVASTPKI